MMSKNSSGINNFFPNSLPEFYFQMGPSRNVYLNYHSPLFNGFSYQLKFFELIYVGEGSVRDVIEDTAVELSTGDICIHNPKIFEPIDNDPVLERFFLHYSAENDQKYNCGVLPIFCSTPRNR